MAFGNRKRGFYTRGGPSVADDGSRGWAPIGIDKNPYYRTMDILNGVFKKNIRLQAGQNNSTDLKTIFVNFGEMHARPITGAVGPGKDAQHTLYSLECGHEWEGKAGHAIDGSKVGMCWACGADQSYLGFEHEWQHIIFKSDLGARALFVKQYAQSLIAQAPHVALDELENFLNLFINTFDDLRCNSLWEKVYPGSATQIWKRWKRLTQELGDGINEDFLSYVFAVAFDIPTDPQGEFEPLRPVVEWGVQKVKYRGFKNMLVDVRAVLDRCMGAILAKVPPPPPKQPSQGQPSSSNQASDPTEGQGNEPQPQDDKGQDAESGQQQEGKDGDTGQEDGSSQEGPPPPSGIPSASSLQASPQAKSQALGKLIGGAEPLDEKEEHPQVDPGQVANDPNSQYVKALVAQAMATDIEDLDAVDQQLSSDEPDEDMAQALQQLQDGLAQKSPDSLLTSNAKAKILLIDVTQDGMNDSKAIGLTEEERFAVSRMRTTFFKAMGRQKAKRAPVGNVIDVQALVQYMADRQDPDVFENEAVNQGFAYSILTDMSGSMSGSFPLVCHGTEMLKQALKFPFVTGNLWGFRGGGDVAGRTSNNEVWLYRYAKDCVGYTGTATVRPPGYQKTLTVPVGCGGLTPMNSAINVVVNHLHRRMASGMAKRLFLLTDGSPCHTKLSGQGLSDSFLRQLVAKEIGVARKHGIQVYTLIIGADAISDDECKQMFGHTKYWRKVENQGDSSIDKVLTRLVLENFTKYIRARG